MESLTSNPAVMARMTQMMSDPNFSSLIERTMSDPEMMAQMNRQMRGMGGNVPAMPGAMPGGAGGPPTPDPETIARVMASLGRFQALRAAGGGQQQPPNAGSGNSGGSTLEGNDSDMTEEEMIQEAIARSMRES